MTYKNTEHASDRVLRQRLLLEEYGVTLKWIQGRRNEAADMLSRNELIHQPATTVQTDTFENFAYEMHASEILIPIDYETLRKHQEDDKELFKFRTADSTKLNYRKEVFGKTTLWVKLSHDGGYQLH